jgi:S1-C subfamily serine protease
MRRFVICILLIICSSSFAGPKRFIIDDDEYLDKIVIGCSNLLQKGQLKSLPALRGQVQTKGHSMALASAAHDKLSPPDIYDRLRESTLAVGSYYKCPDCGLWHFNSSSGFVVASNGVVATCCHVITAEDEGVKESYLAAADSLGHVFPVQSVIAADTEADTCFIQIDARNLRPLAMRSDIRAGERIYCLSHPGGNHFMFTQGMIARLNRRRDELPDERDSAKSIFTRPLLFLNVTTEFAPGSSGAAIVDESANVVGQVSSIAELGEPTSGDETNAPAPSVPIRFCIAAEEIQRLANSRLKPEPIASTPKAISHHANHSSTNSTVKVPSNR